MFHEKHFPVEVKKAASPEFDAEFVLSAATPDRVQDTIDPKAYKPLTRLQKVVALFNHSPDKICGYWSKLKVEGDTLVGQLKLASTELGQMIRALIADGVPLGASIGFRGEGDWNEETNGIHFTKLDLIETSITPTPAHPRAMQIAKQFGIALPSSAQDDPSAHVGPGDVHKDVLAKAKAAILAANQTVRSPRPT